jgi:hypothetical protein
MSVAPADTLLGGPWAFIVGLEELRAVVGLDDDDVAGAEVFADMLRRVAEIFGFSEADFAVPELADAATC